MELDDLKKAWQKTELHLEASDALNLQMLERNSMDRSRAALHRFGWAQSAELAFWFAMVVIAAPFWVAHRDVTHFLIAGIVLHAYGVAAICIGVMQLLMIARVDYAAPVANIQERIAELRRLRARSTILLGLPWWLLWVPVSIVGAKWLFGLDIYAPAPGWVFSSLLVGVAGMACTVWFARRYIGRLSSPALARRYLDDLSGCNLNRAQQHVDEIRRFMRE